LLKNLQMRIGLKLSFLCLFVVAAHWVTAQNNFLIFVTQDGDVAIRITLENAYFHISQSGEVEEFGSLTSGKISYNLNGQVDRIGSAKISYNIYDKVSRVGETSISYNINHAVDRIDTLNISYNINGNIEKVGCINFSYNIHNKVNRIGSSDISYDVFNKVNMISDRDGLIMFCNKTKTTK